MDEVIRIIQDSLNLSAADKKEQKETLMEKPSKEHGSFINHSRFESLIQMAWDKPSKTPVMPKLVEVRYPFPKEMLEKFFSLPAVDSPFTCLSKDRLLPALDGSSISDLVDKRIEQVLRNNFLFSATAMRPCMASAWASRASLTLLEKIKRGVQQGHSQKDLMESIESLCLLADFSRQAALDSIRLSGVASATSNTARRLIWLKQWSGDTASKKLLTDFPFKGQRLFGESLDNIVKEASGGKSTLLPQPKQNKAKGRKSKPYRPFRKSESFGGLPARSRDFSRGRTASRGRGRTSWVNKDKTTAKNTQA